LKKIKNTRKLRVIFQFYLTVNYVVNYA